MIMIGIKISKQYLYSIINDMDSMISLSRKEHTSELLNALPNLKKIDPKNNTTV